MKPNEFRQLVRSGQYKSPTNGKCPNYLQCNLVVLRESDAFDFLLFCQRNEKACPLIEVCDVGSPIPKYCCRTSSGSGTDDADLRTDIPKLVTFIVLFIFVCLFVCLLKALLVLKANLFGSIILKGRRH